MILKRYGETVQSVELNFDSRAMTEIGFRRDRKLSMPSEEFAERYEAVETLEFTADADGAVQDEAERAVLSALEEQVRALEGKLDESQVILIESAQGVDYPKTRDRKRNEARDGEIRAHFHWTIDPPLRVGVYRANTCEPGPRSRMRTPLGHAALGVLVLGVATCTFERRPDRAPDTDPANGTRQTATADSVIAVVGGFHDAVERGDLARAASYLDEDAEVYDRSLGADGRASARSARPRGRLVGWIGRRAHVSDHDRAGRDRPRGR